MNAAKWKQFGNEIISESYLDYVNKGGTLLALLNLYTYISEVVCKKLFLNSTSIFTNCATSQSTFDEIQK